MASLPPSIAPCTDLQNGTVLKVVGTGSSLECTESDAGSGQRRDVTEVITTDRMSLVVAMYQRSDGKAVRLLARRGIELPRLPL